MQKNVQILTLLPPAALYVPFLQSMPERTNIIERSRFQLCFYHLKPMLQFANI